MSPTLYFSDIPLPVLAENLILLRYAEYQSRIHRLVTVLKMRFSAYDQTLREYEITDGRGTGVLGPAALAVGLLGAMAHAGPSEPGPAGEQEI